MTILQIINAIPNMDPEARRRLRENVNRRLHGSPKQAAEASQVLDALDEVSERERSQTSRPLSETDAVARIVEAFRDTMSETKRRVVQVLVDNPDQSSEFLTAQCGWHRQAWQMHFGTMCRSREHLLWAAPFEPKRNAPFYCGILADFDEATGGFTLKPEVVEGFRRLGLEPAAGSTRGGSR
jgi:hypothetical protein